MTEAQELVSALLDAEDPKRFFRNRAELMKLPTPKDVEFQLLREEEDIAPDYDDAEAIQWVHDQLERGNEWAWFCAHAVARWYDPVTEQEIEGDDYLGGCSYRSMADFMQEGGYWPDMKDEAYNDLIRNIKRTREKAGL